MRCTSLNMLLLSSLFLSSSGCSGNWREKKVWLQKVQQFRGNCLYKHSICLTFAVTVTLNTALQSFHRILGLTMIHHQLCLVVKGSAVQKTLGKSNLDCISPHSHFDLCDSKLIFWISIWLMMRPLHQVWLQNSGQFRNYHLDKVQTHRQMDRQSDSKYQIIYNKTSMNSDN